MKRQHDFATRAIHAGQEPDPTTGAIMTPIYATSTYVQESPGKQKGFDYSRSINPTRLAYAKCIAHNNRYRTHRQGPARAHNSFGLRQPLRPALIQRPIEFGFDIVGHSATKYLNGHSDLIGGVAVVGDTKELADRMWFLQNSVG